MQASRFEFRYRWWMISSIFVLAFSAYAIDPVNCGAAIAEWMARQRGMAATRDSYRVIFAFGAFLVGVASFLRTWGTAYLREDVMRDARVHTERLLADGPYRHVRNPLYLGNILLAAGVGLMASRVGFVILAAGMTLFVVRLILREEADLGRDQGESYRRYCGAVPRLLPSVLPRVAPAGNTPKWGQAIRAELTYWLFAAAVAAFAFTLNITVFWGVFALAVAASWLQKRPRTKEDAPQESQ
ncbi:MAG TPA: isoprenylcysteine carboxylmethyltransferase family protein [Patescibacteria group bacterium]|nr:isoprenylcysteine carboxylmethyltransferase family protein [Patescibacteria group bacterium]